MKVNIKDKKVDILAMISRLTTGQRYTFFSNGSLSSIDVFESLLNNIKTENIKATISTWQLGIRDARKIKIFLSKYGLDIRILLDVSYENRNPDYFERVKKMIGNHIWLTKNHSKIMVIQSSCMNFCVLSSANFNKNIRYEFFDITESFDLCQKILDGLECFFSGDPISNNSITRPETNEKFKHLFVDKRNVKAFNAVEIIDDFHGIDLNMPELVI